MKSGYPACSSRGIGRAGETIACDYLVKSGYGIVARNLYVGHEEIDIICEDEKYIVFTEVKLRTYAVGGRSVYGRPSAAVNANKRRHIAGAAQQYIRLNPTDKFQRIDVVEITISPVETAEGFVCAEINHIKGAFGAGGRL